MVSGVLEEYREHWPLTVRQVFYRLVGRHGYEKTERGYVRLQEYLVKARRAKIVPFEALRDDGATARWPLRFDGKAGFWQWARRAAETYKRDKRENQRWEILLLVEAAGMVPQAVRVAHPFDVPVMSSGGFDSVTFKHELAATAATLAPVVILHVGDLDPSGVCIFDSMEADVRAFMAEDSPAELALVDFERVAVTLAQAEEYELPTAPAKATDRRGNGVSETVQAEALPPEVLAATIREALERYTDMDQFAEDREREQDERTELLAALDGMETER